MSTMDKKIRVFWHETGHFVAACYNKQHYQGFGTEHITLEYDEPNNDYYGNHQPLRPPDYVPNGPTRHPASLIASLSYGCVFQATQHGPQFLECFDWKGNGDTDINKTSSVAEKIGLFAEEKRPVFTCIENHFEKIKGNPEFKDLFAQDITYLLQSTDNPIKIDLGEVNKIVAAFLPVHEIFYVQFVSELEAIFKPYLKQ